MKHKIKWLAVIIVAAIVLVCGKLLPAEPLAQRAMVVGFGIDAADGDSLKVSAQILNPGSGEDQSGTETTLVTVVDETIAGAMGKISEKASRTVALTHCNVVFIGRKIAEKNNVYSAINYLITNSYLSENAYLFLADDKAEDVLGSNTGFGNNASLYVQALVGLHGEYSDVADKTLQSFVVGYHSLGKSNWLPIVKKESMPSSGGSQGGEEQEEEYVFNLNSVGVFYKNIFVGEYSGDDVASITYVNSDLKKGQIIADGDNDENIVLYLIGNKVKKSFDLATKTVKINIKLQCILKEIIDTGDADLYVDRTTMTAQEKARAEEAIQNRLLSFFAEMQSHSVDIFNLLESYNARYGKKAAGITIQEISVIPEVTISTDS